MLSLVIPPWLPLRYTAKSSGSNLFSEALPAEVHLIHYGGVPYFYLSLKLHSGSSRGEPGKLSSHHITDSTRGGRRIRNYFYLFLFFFSSRTQLNFTVAIDFTASNGECDEGFFFSISISLLPPCNFLPLFQLIVGVSWP